MEHHADGQVPLAVTAFSCPARWFTRPGVPRPDGCRSPLPTATSVRYATPDPGPNLNGVSVRRASPSPHAWAASRPRVVAVSLRSQLLVPEQGGR